ncbi:hypothetical protein AALP_AA4G196400 [Arabis alpina]|uniref:Uncharacterized protein n=1 Tax=Arabis alpina TaxID=50452 RepID=A0A087H4C3_ARAAL|nr:hypothetical protein AALP_AA4G196400 [Arabis alpina]
MAVSKFVMALFFTCLILANSDSFRNRPWEEKPDGKEPEQYAGGPRGYDTNLPSPCVCCYGGPSGCLRCCRYPHEKTNSVEMQKRGRAKEEKASPVWAHGQP